MLDREVRFSWPAGVAFAALCFLLSYPGRLNGDSLFSLMATTKPGLTNNWHSATLQWLWSLPGPVLGQPAGALAIQAVLFGIFAGFLPRLPRDLRGRAALAGEVLLRVALAGATGYIGKDAVILTALLIAVQVLRRLSQARLGAGGSVLLGLVTALFLLTKAPNFLVVVVALALVLPFFIQSRRAYLALIAIALVVGALAVPLNRAVDSVIFKARDLHPDKQLVLFDVAGISARTGQNLFADVPGWPTTALKPPAACYVPYMWDSFAEWAPCGGYATAYDRFDGALKRRWVEAIAAHPIAYAQHRLLYIDYLLESRDHATWGLDGQSINDASNAKAMDEMRRGIAAVKPNRPIALWHPSFATEPMRWLERALFKFPKVQWVGLIICLAVLLFGWTRRHDGIRLGAILAAALGLGNFAMLAVFGVADPARYMVPTVGLAYLALLALLAPPLVGNRFERR
ncbi:hypothetical protein [Sphingomonas immobilis]|nr:hypothetical protein [Sphingomonas sp. CA1-15]